MDCHTDYVALIPLWHRCQRCWVYFF